MEGILEQMQKVLLNKEKKYDKNPELKFNEDYQAVIDNIKKQQQILTDCKKFYFLMRQNDENNDSYQAETTSRAMSMKRRANSRKGTMDFDNIRKESYGSNKKTESRPLTPEEQGFLDRWDQYSKQMDETLEEVYNEMEIMLNKLDVIDVEQDENIRLGKELGDKIDNVHNDLKFTNERLKAIVTELRAPGKICADLTLALILCIMIGVLVFVIRLYMSLEG
jgi:precorrin isomerase